MVKTIKSLLQKPKNSIYLGFMLAGLFIASLLFPILQTYPLMATVEPILEFADCGYCALTLLNIVCIICFVLWTLYCVYMVRGYRKYKPLKVSLYMLVGYLLTNNILALTISKDAMRSNDAFKYLAVWISGTFACLTPIVYGIIFHLIIRKFKNQSNLETERNIEPTIELKQMYKKNKMLIPVIIMSVLCIWTIVSVTVGDFILSQANIGAFIAVPINFIVFFTLRPYFKYVLSLTLMLGLFNLLSFTPYTSTSSFHIGSIGVSFQPITFFVCVLALIIKIPKKEEIVVVESDNFSSDNQKQFDEDVLKFRGLYLNKSSEDLSQIIADKRFTASAIEAAKQIIEERTNIN